MKQLLIGLVVGTYVTRVRDNYRFMKRYPELDRAKELQAAFNKAKAAFGSK
jgi:hypothetical protein